MSKNRIDIGLLIVAIAGIIMTSIVSLFGPGILIKPEVVIQYEIAELDYPDQLIKEMEITRINYLSKNLYEQLIEAFKGKESELSKKFIPRLERSGLEWTDLLKKDEELNKMAKDKRDAIREISAEIAIQIMADLPQSIRKPLGIPNRILHYSVINKGRKAVHNVIIKIEPKGMLYSLGKVNSGNEISKKDQENESIIIELKRLNSTYTVEGSLWYTNRESKKIETPIFASFDEGVAKLEEYQVISQPFPWYFWVIILSMIVLIIVVIIQNQIAIHRGKREI